MTDVCPITFSAKPLSRRRPIATGGSWVTSGGRLVIDLTFDLPMNQTVTPLDNVWLVDNDGDVEPIDVQVWLSSMTLQISTGLGITGGAPVNVSLLTESEGLHSVTGQNVLPIGPLLMPPD